MIIVFHNDQTVEVFPDISSVRGNCEAIDVEEGAFEFFDEYGRRLKPQMTKAVSRKRLPFGVQLIGGGDFDLEVDSEDKGEAFYVSISKAVQIERNPKFASIADLERFISENRRRLVSTA